MSIKLRDVTRWLANGLEGNGFPRSDKQEYAVVDAAWVEDGTVVLNFGSETIRLTVSRD